MLAGHLIGISALVERLLLQQNDKIPPPLNKEDALLICTRL